MSSRVLRSGDLPICRRVRKTFEGVARDADWLEPVLRLVAGGQRRFADQISAVFRPTFKKIDGVGNVLSARRTFWEKTPQGDLLSLGLGQLLCGAAGYLAADAQDIRADYRAMAPMMFDDSPPSFGDVLSTIEKLQETVNS